MAFDPSLPISNPHLQTDNGVLGFARSLDLWGYSGKFGASVAYTWLSGSADYLGHPYVDDPGVARKLSLHCGTHSRCHVITRGAAGIYSSDH